jgi:hypothetical protein
LTGLPVCIHEHCKEFSKGEHPENLLTDLLLSHLRIFFGLQEFRVSSVETYKAPHLKIILVFGILIYGIFLPYLCNFDFLIWGGECPLPLWLVCCSVLVISSCEHETKISNKVTVQ